MHIRRKEGRERAPFRRGFTVGPGLEDIEQQLAQRMRVMLAAEVSIANSFCKRMLPEF